MLGMIPSSIKKGKRGLMGRNATIVILRRCSRRCTWDADRGVVYSNGEQKQFSGNLKELQDVAEQKGFEDVSLVLSRDWRSNSEYLS